MDNFNLNNDKTMNITEIITKRVQANEIYDRETMWSDLKYIVLQLKYANRVNIELAKRLEKNSHD